MEFNRYYLVHLLKGPTWEPEDVSSLQEQHLAHLGAMTAQGKLILAGPLDVHSKGDSAARLRGICFYDMETVADLAELRALVEADPAIQGGRLRAEYFTWFTTPDATLGRA